MSLPKKLKMRKHVHMGDCQLKPGVPMNHLEWIAQYVNSIGADVFIDAGDFADMPSLSFWDRGKLKAEGSRVKADMECVTQGLELLHGTIETEHKIITCGNHEHRIERAVESDAKWEGMISTDDLGYYDYYDQVGKFLEVITVDGIAYCHFFQRKNSGKPWGGSMMNRLNKIGYSHVAGHSPGFEHLGEYLSNGTQRVGMVNGACYLHYEDYKGPQDNLMHFRGIVILNEVDGKGGFLPMPVSLEYLCRRYENVTLAQFAKQKKKWIYYGKKDTTAMDWLLN